MLQIAKALGAETSMPAEQVLWSSVWIQSLWISGAHDRTNASVAKAASRVRSVGEVRPKFTFGSGNSANIAAHTIPGSPL